MKRIIRFSVPVLIFFLPNFIQAGVKHDRPQKTEQEQARVFTGDKVPAAPLVQSDDPIFLEEFEPIHPDWTYGDVRNMNGVKWHLDTTHAYSGKSWWCGDPDIQGYLDHWYQSLTTPLIDLTGATSPILSFMHFYATQYDTTQPPEDNPFDGCHVRCLVEGDTAFRLITPVEGYDPPDNLEVWAYHNEPDTGDMPGWHGTNSTWEEASFDLTPFIGKKIQLRFIFASDAFQNTKTWYIIDRDPYQWAEQDDWLGWFIDDIRITDGDDTLFFDDAEDSLIPSALTATEGSGLYHEGWQESTERAHSPTRSWNCANGISQQSVLVSPWIDLPDCEEDIILSYWLYADMPDWDGDGDSKLEDYYELECLWWGIDWWAPLFYDYDRLEIGLDEGWVQMRPGIYHDANLMKLNGYKGERIKLRWRVVSDDNHDSGMGEGFFIDDVMISARSPRTWTVDDDEEADFRTISEAIAFSMAKDTILVKDGLYHENIIVNFDYITIQSENGNAGAVIQPLDPVKPIMTLAGHRIKVGGFTLQGGNESQASAIQLKGDAYYCILESNRIMNNNIGIAVAPGSYTNSIYGNQIVNNTVGIDVAGIDHTIYNGTIYYNNFMENTSHVTSYAGARWYSKNTMHYLYGGQQYENYLGNHWGDYSGPDEDQDGIGDEAYVTAGDEYPLMGSITDYAAFSTSTIPSSNLRVNRTITFRSTVLPNPALEISSYHWDFGDGSQADGQNVTHQYGQGGSYTVTFTLTSNLGVATVTKNLLVEGFSPRIVMEDALGGTVTWVGKGDQLHSDSGHLAWRYANEIFYYDGSTTDMVTNDAVEDMLPQVDNGRVYWRRGENSKKEKTTKYYSWGTVTSSSTVTTGIYPAKMMCFDGSYPYEVSNGSRFKYWENIKYLRTYWGVIHVQGIYDIFGNLVSGKWEQENTLVYDGDVLTGLHCHDGRVIWMEKNSGNNHEYLYHYDGQEVTTLVSGSVRHPRFVGDDVLFMGYDGGWEVMLHDGDQVWKLSDNEIGERFASGTGIGWYSGTGDETELYLSDGQLIYRLTDNSTEELDMMTDGDQAVWCGFDGNDYEIFYYEDQQVQQITNNEYDDRTPFLKSGRIVWVGAEGIDSEIFMYDGETVHQITSNERVDESPEINEDWIVWRGFDSQDYEIFLYDGSDIVLLSDNGIDDGSPHLEGIYITWQDTTSNIYIRSPATSVVKDDFTGQLPLTFKLEQNYPNPFNPETTIQYQTPYQSNISIKIYNVLGQKIRTLLDERKEAGYYTIKWDGNDDHVRPVSSGIYIYRIEAASSKKKFIEMKKMMLVR